MLKKPTKKEILHFLQQSNLIEGVSDARSLDDAYKAWEYLSQVDVLTLDDVLKTHWFLMENQPLEPHEKGFLRRCEVRIGRSFGTTSDLIGGELKEWIDLMNAPRKELLDRQIDWQVLHVEYERIHPFADGNGRTGRMFMNWYRLKNGYPLLTIDVKDRWEYYKWFR